MTKTVVGYDYDGTPLHRGDRVRIWEDESHYPWLAGKVVQVIGPVPDYVPPEIAELSVQISEVCPGTDRWLCITSRCLTRIAEDPA